ncbi:MAG TPA: hypothetical protein VNS88_14495, partial [Nitrospiraceae bacterium]|nr:hypothetical protein [Nitrospiraceae bacterium]
MAGRAAPSVVWSPQPGPQTALIQCPVFEVFYGGSRGGGKTEGSVGDWLEHSSVYGEAAIGVFFRRKFKQLEEVVARTKQVFPSLGAKWNEQQATWTMRGKGRLKFRYLERDADAEEYQGHSYTRVYVEEVTNFPSSAPVNLLRATVRSASGVKVGMRLTGNPGGPGHNWVKARYITPWPAGWKILRETVKGYAGGPDLVTERVFIPSGLKDNKLLLERDPMYVARLRQAGSEQLVKAWLEGNWDLIDGAFFDCWDEHKHVLAAGEWMDRIPPYATRFLGFDWGYARPFCCLWFAVSDGTWGLPDQALVVYREFYGWNGMPNTGIRMNPDQVSRGILSRQEMKEVIDYGSGDPSIWTRDGGPAIGETMMAHGVSLKRADNKRTPGWAEVRRRLVGQPAADGGNEPLLYVLSNCTELIRTLPTLQHDETNVEDLDTEGEDHAAD